MEDVAFVEKLLKTKCCTIINADSIGQWIFTFDDEFYFNIECTWRIIAESRIALAVKDHGQKFSGPVAVDGVAEAGALIKGKPVTAVRVDQDTADLRIEFEGGARLEAFVDSRWFESWTFGGYDKGAPLVVALGGGGLEVFR